MFHSLLLVIWNWTNVKICSLNEIFYNVCTYKVVYYRAQII
jgi:hypothetical protein